MKIILCGAGAVGGNLAQTLARQNLGTLTVIDCDRIEQRNLSTQPYTRAEIGAQKAKALANTLYRAVGAGIQAETRQLTATNVRSLLSGADLVVDAFDNSASRRVVTEYCAGAAIPCLHIGLADGYAEILWNDGYRVPDDTGLDPCHAPLARNLVLLAVSVAAEFIRAFLETGERRSATVTLGDLRIIRA